MNGEDDMRKEYDLYVKRGKCGAPQPCIDCNPPRIICNNSKSATNPCCNSNYCKVGTTTGGCGCLQQNSIQQLQTNGLYAQSELPKAIEKPVPYEGDIHEEIDFEISSQEYEIRTDITV